MGDFFLRERWTTQFVKHVEGLSMMPNKCSQLVDRILLSNGHWGNKTIYMAQREAKEIWHID